MSYVMYFMFDECWLESWYFASGSVEFTRYPFALLFAF
jgi:hypothetical protein